MLKKLFGKTIIEFVNPIDCLNIVAKDSSGHTKEIRDVTDRREMVASFDRDKVEEKYTVKQKPKLETTQQKQEIRVVNRFLSVFNSQNSSRFEVAPNQPSTNSHIDVLIVEVITKEEIGLQIRVSDDEPWKELHKNRYFQRYGQGFKIHRDAIKKAIESKLKYPIALRQQIILLLDGWLGVRSEDLEHFIKTETECLRTSGYRAIWFVGSLPETIMKLYNSQRRSEGF